ncbi:MAG: hypothetical protein K2P94_16645 [Rhodospirillaceae bacterium]|nr:hypothetical protein [Rhodospirillaceae bacterium]
MVQPESPKDALHMAPLRKGKSDEGDDESPGGPAPKQKTLPTGLSRAIVIAAVIASITIAATGLLAHRYDLVAADNSTNGFMYRIDRLTGAVQFCGPQGCTDVSRAEK